MTYWARSANREGIKQSQKEHLIAVQERATRFAKVMGLEDEARVAGLLHDIGKYGGLFQDVLDGREHGIDHSSMGASIAWKECGAWYAALVIAAHHAGLGVCRSIDRLSRISCTLSVNMHESELLVSK